MEVLVATTQIRWAGHVIRTGEEHAMFLSKLKEDQESSGRDVLNQHFKTADVNINIWESEALNCPVW